MIVCPWKDLGRYSAVIPGLEDAMCLIAGLKTWEPAVYPLPDGGRVVVGEGTTLSTENAQLEAHRKYLDIQYVLEGQEVVGWAPLESLTPAGEFNIGKDIGMYRGSCDYVRIGAGFCYVVFPEDAHMPGRHLDAPNDYRKIVVKLKL